MLNVVLLLLAMVKANSVKMTDLDLTIDSFSLLDGDVGDSELFQVGEMAKMRFKFKATTDVSDNILIDVTSSYNDFSALVFCGEPTISGNHYPKLITGLTIDAYALPRKDSFIFDFGELTLAKDDEVAIEFEVMLINHPNYKAGLYWFGVAVGYNAGNSIFVTDIAFELGDITPPTGDIEFDPDPPETIVAYEGAAFVTVVMTNPYDSVGFKFISEVVETVTYSDSVCVCDIRINAIYGAFQGCLSSSSSQFPPYRIKFDPPYNSTGCKKQAILDFGALTKMGSSGSADEIRIDVGICLQAGMPQNVLFVKEVLKNTVDKSLTETTNEEVSNKQSITLDSRVGSAHELTVNEGVLHTLSYRTVTTHSALSFQYNLTGTVKKVYSIRVTMSYPTGMFEDVRGRYIARERYTSPHIPQILQEEELITHSAKSYTKVKCTFRKVAVIADVDISSEKSFSIDITGKATALAENITDNVMSTLYVMHDDVEGEELQSVNEIIEFDEVVDPPEDHCKKLEVSYNDIRSLNPGQSIFYAESFTSLTLILTMPEECDVVTYFPGLNVSFETEIPSELDLSSAYLYHVGDNFASVILDKVTPVYKERSSATRTLYNGSATFYLNEVTYIPVNTKDVYDRQLKFQVNLFISEKYINYEWNEAVTASINLHGISIQIEIVSLSLYYDIDTLNFLYVNVNGNTETIMRDNDPQRNPQTGYVQSQWPYDPPGDPILGEDDQKIVLRFGFYITPAKFFNQYRLSVKLTSESNVVITRKNMFGRNLETLYKFTEMEHGDLNGSFVIANMESFKNYTSSDYQVITFLYVSRYPGTTSGSSQIEMEYCYIPDLTNVPHCYPYSYTVQFASELPTAEPEFNWKAYPPKIDFISLDTFTPEFIKGGAYMRFINVYVPFKTARIYKVVAEIDDDFDYIYISNIGVEKLGEYVLYSPFHPSSGFSQEKGFTSPVADGMFYKKGILNLGYINNINYNLSTHITPNFEIEACAITLKIVFGSLEQSALDVNFPDSFELKMSIHDGEGNILINPAYYTTYSLVSAPTTFQEITISSKMVHVDLEDPATLSVGENNNYNLSFYLSPGISDKMNIQVISPIQIGPEFVILDVSLLSAGRNVFETLDSKEMAAEYTNRINEYGMQEYICIFSLNTVTNHGFYVNNDDYNLLLDNELKFRITIKLQDEDTIAKDAILNIHYSAYLLHSKIVTVGIKRFFVTYPTHRRPILRSHVNSSMLVTGREPVPGDYLKYTVHLYHACNSTSKAKDVKITAFFPRYSNFISTNDTLWVGVLPDLIDGGLDHSFVKYQIGRIHLTEYFKFVFYIKIDSTDSFFVLNRIYFITIPLEVIFQQKFRNEDQQSENFLFSLKMDSQQTTFTLIDSACNDHFEVHTFHPCQLHASSVHKPLTHSPEFASLKNVTGWQSNNYGGQYEGNQFLQFSLLNKYRITRIYINFMTTVLKFRLEYCLDSLGIYWLTYEELGEERIFDIHDAMQSFHSSPLSDSENSVYYLDIRVPFIARWLRFVFIENSDLQITWRFMIAGCLAVPDGDLRRACQSDDADIRRPELYQRGFIADQDSRNLYVCEKNLKLNKNQCLRMKYVPPSKFTWTYLSSRVHSIFGYCYAPFLRLFAVSSNFITYLSSDDGGNTWITVSATEFWKCRDNTGLYKEVRKMPTFLTSHPVPIITDEKLIDGFYYDDIEFRANLTGIFMNEGDYDWRLIYDWGRQCCTDNI